MNEDLRVALADHLQRKFPESVERGMDYGLIDAVMIGADLHGWASSIASGSVLSERDYREFRRASDELSASLLAIPIGARVYYTGLLFMAELALASQPHEV